jgi:hypothetical protein
MPPGVYGQEEIDILRSVFDDICDENRQNAALRATAPSIDLVALVRALLMTFDRGIRHPSDLKAGALEFFYKDAFGAIRWLGPVLAARGVRFVVDCASVPCFAELRTEIRATPLSDGYPLSSPNPVIPGQEAVKQREVGTTRVRLIPPLWNAETRGAPNAR